MKKLLLLIISVFLTIHVFGKEVTVDQAKEAALSFLQHSKSSALKSTSQFTLTNVGDLLSGNFRKLTQLKSTNTQPQVIYVFNINDNEGFIIVSGDDAAIPILGYSSSRGIDVKNLPPNFIKWIEGYKQQILFIRANNIDQTDEIKDLWKGRSSYFKSAQSSVSPLISTQWNQAPYVNAKCPYDYIDNTRTLTGCVATAMAQIMKYWEHPLKGFGNHSYPTKLYVRKTNCYNL